MEEALQLEIENTTSILDNLRQEFMRLNSSISNMERTDDILQQIRIAREKLNGLKKREETLNNPIENS